jgi:tRNA pseudouridine55 synthase
VATARLGVRTDSDDLTGRIVASSDTARLDSAQVANALAEFVGTTLQRPPDFSAKHVGGERSYQKARRGETVQLEPVSVTVTRLEMLECELPLVTFRATVSAGTYIRGIARDLGERLGVGAHLTSLRREAIGALRVEDSTPLADLSAAALIPASQVLGNIGTVELDPDMRMAVSHGRAVVDSGEAGTRESGAVVGLLGDGQLVAIAKAEDGWLRPIVVLETS